MDTEEIRTAVPCDETELQKMQEMKNRLPLYPEPLLEKNEEHDIPSYQGDMDDLNERRNVKLYNLWSVWSDLRQNEKLIQLLEAQKKDTADMKFLKAMLTLTVDRMGKVLADTNIVEELCVKENRRSECKEESLDHDGQIYQKTSSPPETS